MESRSDLQDLAPDRENVESLSDLTVMVQSEGKIWLKVEHELILTYMSLLLKQMKQIQVYLDLNSHLSRNKSSNLRGA